MEEKELAGSNDFMFGIPCDEAIGCLDPLFEQVVKWVQARGCASISGLQRNFGIAYSRASRLMDQLEAAGIIGPADGSKPRKVLPYDFRIHDLLDDEFEVVDMTKEEKLDTIDALILDIQDYRKKVEAE